MDNINDIIASLTPDDIDALKATAESIFGAGATQQSSSESHTDSQNQSQSSSFNPTDLGAMISPEMFSKIAGIMSAMNSDGGKRCNLIEALKPNLSPDRQKKADDAMQMLKLMDILPMLNNFTKRDD